MMLTEHFSMAEMIATQQRGIDNTPDSASIRANITRTAQLLERIRELLGAPVIVTSGYRCPVLNRAVGGSVNSAHMQGLAADILAPEFGVPYDVCRKIEPHLAEFGIDQLIYEGAWSHCGLREGEPRHQALTWFGGADYRAGIMVRGAS
jgi:zinc D-Ala-D-Ala carboxypeptidase